MDDVRFVVSDSEILCNGIKIGRLLADSFLAPAFNSLGICDKNLA